MQKNTELNTEMKMSLLILIMKRVKERRDAKHPDNAKGRHHASRF